MVIPAETTPPGMEVTMAWKRELTIQRHCRMTLTRSYIFHSSLIKSGADRASFGRRASHAFRSNCSIPTRIGKQSVSLQNPLTAPAIALRYRSFFSSASADWWW